MKDSLIGPADSKVHRDRHPENFKVSLSEGYTLTK